MIDTVLFDFDGTLLNTNFLIFDSYEYAFKKVIGRSITKEEIHNLYGRPLYPSLAEYGDAQDELYSEYRKFNMENHDKLVRTFPDAAKGVIKLKKKGYKLAVVTSKRYDTLIMGLDILGLGDTFDVLITPNDTDKHKPHPMPILIACEKLDAKPENSIMVGDSIFDFECGKNAGTYLAGVNYSTTKNKLIEYTPLYMVDTIDELAEKIINE